ncbi:MAG: mechanosensitive ion channel, partial [Bacteroidales bacterium]|nr:mechanosensitive ion channel [Bacteroidales bacterium]
MIPIDPLKSPAQDSILILSDIARKVQGKSAGEVGNMIVSGAVSLGLKIVCAAVIYAIGIWLIRKVRRLLHKVMEKKEMEPSLASFLSSAANVAMILVLTFIIIGILGINTTSIAALIASGGLALGMALSGALQNFAGGLMILAFKPFKVGDYIELQGGAAGYVQSITIISTYLRTTDNR